MFDRKHELTRVPSFAVGQKAMREGFQLIDLESFGFVRDIGGADDHGYNQASDVLAATSVDGVDYRVMWREFQDTIRIQNAERTAIVSFLSYTVSNPVESVSQLSGAKFQKAGEYSEPRGVRQTPTSFWLGYGFDDYDIAIRYTWRYLRDATAEQTRALHASVIEADNQMLFEGVLQALYAGNVNREADINDRPYTVYGLYNADGTVPPTYKSNTFDGTHTHYLVSGAATVDFGDLDAVMEHMRHHGFSAVNNAQQLIAVNSREGKTIRTFRIANGATYDFIPAAGQALPLILEPGQTVSGARPAATYRGLNVIGAYGEALIIEDDNFPPGYVLGMATGGRDNLTNPVGIREHQNPANRGLQLIKGPDNDYPLTDSFYLRSFGTGIRQRGGAVVMQIKASGSYTPPTQYIY